MLYQVAIPVPVRRLFTYRVPHALVPYVVPGVRVLVPFGPRRTVGYAIAPAEHPPREATLRDVDDVLDARPLLDEPRLRFVAWMADYYRVSLGEMLRTALPAGLGAPGKQRVRLTAEGRARLETALHGLDARTVRILGAISKEGSGAVAVQRLRRKLRVTLVELRTLADAGLVELVAGAPSARARTERVAVWVGEPSHPPVSDKERRIAETIRAAGEVAVRELNRAFGRTCDNLRRLREAGAIVIEERRVWRLPRLADATVGGAAGEPPPLTSEQRRAVETIVAKLGSAGTLLLQGVTGSGKTEVYLRVIEAVLARGQGALVLAPEIALTPQLVARFAARFGARIAVLHSGLTSGERLDQWEQIAAGRLPVVIGARSALFAPVPRLGVIVVDEEHELSFKQEDRPTYHARDCAVMLGHMLGCPTVLGSATPSLETWHNARRGRYARVALSARPGGRPLPDVEIVDLRTVERLGDSALLSEPLVRALAGAIRRGEQAILLLNRRGFSPFVLCAACGHVPQCPQCAVALTYTRKHGRLRCHYCGHERRLPARCPECNGAPLAPVGAGTERIEEDLAALLGSGVRVGRMDRDTTRGRGLQRLLRAFRSREIDVLVGTQMVAKGHDFPGVTLVGVLAADQGLRFPDFRAAEHTWQLLSQVAGRAGRGSTPGRVLVQTWMPEHPLFEAVVHHDAEAFLRNELAARMRGAFPPARRMALVRITAKTVPHASDVAGRCAEVLRSAARRFDGADVLGPTWAPLQQLKGRVRAQVLVRATTVRALHAVLDAMDEALQGRSVQAQVTVDVDPHHFL